MGVRAVLSTVGLLLLSLASPAADPVASKADLEPVADSHGSVLAVSLSPDGKLLASGGFGRVVRLWDTATGQEVRQLEHPRGVHCLAFSGDGKLLASAGDQRVRLWDPQDGKELHSLKVAPGDAWCVALSPDGRTLATAGQTIRLWDTASGKQRGQLAGHTDKVFALTFSPDGQSLASGGEDGGLCLWDVAQRSQLRRWEPGRCVTCLAFRPDGKAIAVATSGEIRLWDTAADAPGAVNFNLGFGRLCVSLAFSADGRVLVAGDAEGLIRSWETHTGKERPRLRGFRGTLLPVSFHFPSQALPAERDPLEKLWDVADPGKELQPSPFHLTEDEFTLLWEDLAGGHTALADEAVRTLSRDSRQTIPFLTKHLEPEKPFPAIASLIADLDSKSFQVRQRATQQLERCGKAAVPALKQVLKNRPPLEVRRRIEMILERIEICSPEQQRTRRAIRVLRRLGTPEARQLLKVLAGGAPEGMTARQAQEALQALGEE